MCRGRVSIGVGVRGLEPRASSLSGTRSNRLSYTPEWQPYRLGYSTAFLRLLATASIRLAQGHLDAADGLRDQVVDDRPDREQRRDEDDVQRAEHGRVAEDERRGEPVRDVRARRVLGGRDRR